ncbi:MAG: DKNYY domain-containing protein [Bacteroidetes bacterium]|nr:DKNYY domain-containing protein [Bacteroidota bacterium]
MDSVGGGTDEYRGVLWRSSDDFEILWDADPKTIKVLNPDRGCWNCGNCYFVDDKSVYFGLVKIKVPDPKTFKLVNKETIDAEDKNGKYFEGKAVQ